MVGENQEPALQHQQLPNHTFTEINLFQLVKSELLFEGLA